MTNFKVGDEIITISPLLHYGKDIGDRLGRIVSIFSYIMVDIYQYNNNPVKCFRREVKLVTKEQDVIDELEYLFSC